MPVGVLGLAGACRAALALRRPAAVAARPDRADRARRAVHPPRLHAGRLGSRLPDASATAACRSRRSRAPASPPPGSACRAIVAARLQSPEYELPAFRALQFGWFTTPLVLDDADDLAVALQRVDGLDVAAARRRARSARRSRPPTRPTAPRRGPPRARRPRRRARPPSTDGDVRYTAPSLVFAHEGRRLEAGGFQPVEAYDVVLANLDPTLDRTPPPQDPLEALGRVPVRADHLRGGGDHDTQQERARPGAPRLALIDHVADGRVIREPLGDGALWRAVRPRHGHRSGPGQTAQDQAAASPR